MDEEKFDVVFHHGGKFMNEGKLIYAYGESRTLSCDQMMKDYLVSF